MSALGQERTLRPLCRMSALLTLIERLGMSALCQNRTNCNAAKLRLFDHLVGSYQQCLRHSDPQRFGGLKINNQFEFC
jgi:hypothetical protein